jgi:hypothetical protein
MDPSFDPPVAPLADCPEASVRRVQSSSGIAVEAIRDGSRIHMRHPGEAWRSEPYVLAFELLVELLALDPTDADQAAEAHLLLRVLNAGENHRAAPENL